MKWPKKVHLHANDAWWRRNLTPIYVRSHPSQLESEYAENVTNACVKLDEFDRYVEKKDGSCVGVDVDCAASRVCEVLKIPSADVNGAQSCIRALCGDPVCPLGDSVVDGAAADTGDERGIARPGAL